MNKKHIVVVEDEQHLAIGIKYNLEAEGYRVTTISDGPTALSYCELNESEIDLIILDLMLPGMSGYAVCEGLRNAGFDMPVLILSARNMSGDRARGFDVGASQYLTKPFDLDELISRVRNLLLHHKRAARPEAANLTVEKYDFGEFHINFLEAQVFKGDQQITLTRRELELLRYFCENEGRLIPRPEIIEKVWELPGHIQTRAPDQFLLRLRKLFEPDPANPRHLLTFRDLGYKFLAKPQESGSG